ncbi:HPr family phosphocarrier protein [Gulosibacter sp. 10]|uniref:HPr family phosphocarrier protein n=1 Tax=Gulosibacter sp. 10 TaxID=1255570 RepID=UPI00097F4BA2|nr:HPr family phosphocarrier protein [Gulosibacter sp. 10]SJM65702.1 Phosphotransferase system, phosphocarrier protein HPr [Gulosibacter sp. 10]
MADVISKTVTLTNETGLHARPASEFVKAASSYDADVKVNGVDAKSLLGIMAMGAKKGTELEIAASGAQAQDAVDGLVALVESGFGE